jgi:orotidine-5'-phosphate decarboxylase
LFDTLDADAATVNPYLGWDGLEPFLEYSGRGVLVLCKTSNPGSADLQELMIDGRPLYLHVATAALRQQARAEVGLVVGATQAEALERVRRLDEQVLILAPGVGAQGAAALDAVRIGGNTAGENLLASVSRDILYASSDASFTDSARAVAQKWAAETWAAGEHYSSPA